MFAKIDITQALECAEPESLRMLILAYLRNALIKGENLSKMPVWAEMIRCFANPYYSPCSKTVIYADVVNAMLILQRHGNKGQRVIVMGNTIRGTDGKLFAVDQVQNEQFKKAFFSLLHVSHNYNLVFDAVIRYNKDHELPELILCDCFHGQDWNNSKLAVPVVLRMRMLQAVLAEADDLLMQTMRRSLAQMTKNYRAVSHVWFFNIKDVKAEYTTMSYRKDATGLILIDSRQVNPYEIYLEETDLPFKFEDDERCWKMLIEPPKEEPVAEFSADVKMKRRRKSKKVTSITE